MGMKFKKLQDQKMALYSCQRAIRSYMMAKTWLWLQLWLAIKPNLRCSQFGKFKKEYEDKIAEAEANIDGAVAARAKVQAVYDGFAAQKNELQLALNSGGSAVQDMIDKAVRIENQAADVQKDLDQTNARIKNEKAQKVALIPVPLPMMSFTGSKASFLGDSHFYGKQGINFYTETKTVTSLWRSDDATSGGKADVAMPVPK